jgi:hypothetical protein
MNTGAMSASAWMSPQNRVVPIALKLDTEKLAKSTYKLTTRASDAAGRESESRQSASTIE